MGKRGGRGGGRGGRGRGGGRAPAKREDWNDLSTTNAQFEGYYKKMGIVSEDEWEEFLDYMRKPLPTTFRLTGSRSTASSLDATIEETYVPFLTGLLDHEGNPLEPPTRIPWYPNGHAWQLQIAKQHIRKIEAFKRFQGFLVSETEAGNLSRQEAVSMIPPLLLDVQPQHRVLDMCAAPGSKSAQLLEALNPASGTNITDDSTAFAGLLVANDSDYKRCHMLVHQSLNRIPVPGMMVTNCDASLYPALKEPPREITTAAGKKKKVQRQMHFDRILADVPCSGDGTMRKNPSIWKDWTINNGAGLHGLQLRILTRGIQLLKSGGRIVYSTCSMNPVENEAVISAALDAFPNMHLVDASSYLPNLKRRPGLTTWPVLDSNLNPVEYVEPVPGKVVVGRKPLPKSTWPNGKEAERHLERCLRLYAMDQDTGGFFVAVLEKDPPKPRAAAAAGAAPVEGEAEAEGDEEVKEEDAAEVEEVKEATKRSIDETAPSTQEESTEEPAAKRLKLEEDELKAEEAAPEATMAEASTSTAVANGGSTSAAPAPAEQHGKQQSFREEPYIYLSADDEQVKLCMDFFDIHPSFPSTSLLVRNRTGQALRTIYLTSPLCRQLIQDNNYARIRLISCGVKVFSRQESSKEGVICKWRVTSEGLEVLKPFMGPKRRIVANEKAFKRLLAQQSVKFEELKEEDPAFIEGLEKMEVGSAVVEVKLTFLGSKAVHDMTFAVWRSPASVNLMVEKVERGALSCRLYGEDITPFAGGKGGKKAAPATATAEPAAAATEAPEAVPEARTTDAA